MGDTAEKPKSVVETEMVDGELRVFAHISNPVDEYGLSDSSALGRFLSAEMNYMLLDAIEESRAASASACSSPTAL